MQFQLLGTGPSSPIPRIFCSCRICQSARKRGSKEKRTRSSALLSVHGKHILFDAGPDVLQQLERANTFCVDALFFTHAHNDAAGGFFDLDDLVKYQNHSTTLYVEPGTWKRLARNLDYTEIWFKIKMIQPGKTINIFGTSITPFRVLHSATPGFPTVGYKIGKNLVYASDIRKIPMESEKYIRGISHAVLDGCMWFGSHIPTHLSTDKTIELARKLGVKNLYLTQISHRYPPYREAQKKIDAFVKQQNCATRVQLGYDGMRIAV